MITLYSELWNIKKFHLIGKKVRYIYCINPLGTKRRFLNKNNSRRLHAWFHKSELNVHRLNFLIKATVEATRVRKLYYRNIHEIFPFVKMSNTIWFLIYVVILQLYCMECYIFILILSKNKPNFVVQSIYIICTQNVLHITHIQTSKKTNRTLKVLSWRIS